MISVAAARSTELLPLRVRLAAVGTIDGETERRDHQQGGQIHLTHQEICAKNRSHPSLRPQRCDSLYTAYFDSYVKSTLAAGIRGIGSTSSRRSWQPSLA
jgi:hypothetical protein